MAKCGTTVSRLPFGLSDVPPCPRYETSCQVCIWSDVRSGQHHVRCTPQLKKLSGHWKMIDLHGQLLHQKRPFTQEGSYLVPFVVSMPIYAWWHKNIKQGIQNITHLFHFFVICSHLCILLMSCSDEYISTHSNDLYYHSTETACPDEFSYLPKNWV